MSPDGDSSWNGGQLPQTMALTSFELRAGVSDPFKAKTRVVWQFSAFISVIYTTFVTSRKRTVSRGRVRLPNRIDFVAVRSDEHGDGRAAIGFDLVVVRSFRLVEACDNQKI